MNVVYIHDFCLYRNSKLDIFTAVGLPENYFDRFFDSQVKTVELISRNKILSDLEIKDSKYEKLHNEQIQMPIIFSNYLCLLSPYILYKVARVLKKSDLVVLNFPSVNGLFCWFLVKVLRIKYSVEVAADFDQFKNKKFGSIFTKLISYCFPRVISGSSGVIYVNDYLRVKYYHSNSIVASNVKIDGLRPKSQLSSPIIINDKFKITLIGGVTKRKGVDVCIRAAKNLIDCGVKNFQFNIVGGHADFDYETLLDELCLNEYFIFHGIQSRESVWNILADTDIYCQPSVSEGLPRATIEAMSFGIPVIATDLPGFRELLPSDYLIGIGNDIELADLILKLVINLEVYNAASNENIEVAKNFVSQKLKVLRAEFYSKILSNNRG